MYTSSECLDTLRTALHAAGKLGPVPGSPWMEEWRRRERMRVAELRARSGDPSSRDSGHDAAVAEVLRRGIPPHLSSPIAVRWLACAICGAKPDTYWPLPRGWAWDSFDPSNTWVWCPDHRE